MNQLVLILKTISRTFRTFVKRFAERYGINYFLSMDTYCACCSSYGYLVKNVTCGS